MIHTWQIDRARARQALAAALLAVGLWGGSLSAAVAQTNPCERLMEAGALRHFMWQEQDLCAVRIRLQEARAQGGGQGVQPQVSTATAVQVNLVLSDRAPQDHAREPARPVVARPGDDFRADTWMNIRSGPGVDHGVVGRARQDEQVTLTGNRYGEWWQVTHRNKARTVTGWVFSVWLRRVDE